MVATSNKLQVELLYVSNYNESIAISDKLLHIFPSEKINIFTPNVFGENQSSRNNLVPESLSTDAGNFQGSRNIVINLS